MTARVVMVVSSGLLWMGSREQKRSQQMVADDVKEPSPGERGELRPSSPPARRFRAHVSRHSSEADRIGFESFRERRPGNDLPMRGHRRGFTPKKAEERGRDGAL